MNKTFVLFAAFSHDIVHGQATDGLGLQGIYLLHVLSNSIESTE